MTYACPGREFAADKQLLKLQRMRNKVLHSIENAVTNNIRIMMTMDFQEV
jgi:hypothetical protein